VLLEERTSGPDHLNQYCGLCVFGVRGSSIIVAPYTPADSTSHLQQLP
jgi:hypothetical protein